MKKALVAKRKNVSRGEFVQPARDVFVYFDQSNNDTFGAGVCEIPPGSHNEKHAHADADEVIYVILGEMSILAGDSEHLLQQGDAIFIPRRVEHQIFNNSDNDPLLHTFTFSGTGPADAIATGYGIAENFIVHPAEE